MTKIHPGKEVASLDIAQIKEHEGNIKPKLLHPQNTCSYCTNVLLGARTPNLQQMLQGMPVSLPLVCR